MTNKLKKNFKLQIILVVFSYAIIIFSLSLVLQYNVLYSENKKLILSNGNKTIIEKHQDILKLLNKSKSILHSMNDALLFQNYLNDKNNNKELLQSLFKVITKNNSNIMQFRYINNKGQEEIRVQRDLENKAPYIIFDTELQDKSNRGYFYKSIKKTPNNIWYSALDLNIEKGEVEIPFKPTLRAILPMERDGNFKGILIINYFMESFLKSLQKSPTYDIVLTNKYGDTIVHYDHKKDWGILKERSFNLQDELQLDFNTIDLSQIYIGSDFLLKKLHTPIKNDLILFVKTNQIYIDLYNKNFIKKALLDIVFFIITVIIVTIITVKIINNILKELKLTKIENKDIKELITKEVEQSKEKDRIIFQQNKHVSMGHMIENIAHQWRQPLTEVNSLVCVIDTLLRDETLNKKELVQKLDEIEDINAYMSQTIEDFRTFLNKSSKTTQKFLLDECVKKSLKILETTFEKNNIDIICNCEKIYVTNYPNELQQAILSLLNNAKDALIETKPENPKIEINLQELDNHYRITIQDNGGGIDENIMDQIYEPYFTTKHQSIGTGIGLFITKMIIETSIKGELLLENKKDGICCTIDIKKESKND